VYLVGVKNKATSASIFNSKNFKRTGILACSSVLLLFLLGGLVRATGSGMGCPDWPKCFGLLMPPTCECQLPPDYQDIYLQKRLAKVERLAGTLEKFGFASKAAQLRADQTILEPEAFNVNKAWIEYINRIFGVIAGLLAVAFLAIAFIGKNSTTTRVFVVAGFIMLILNAWLGSIVVATNLLPGIVTIHFLFSFLCVFMFMLAMNNEHPFRPEGSALAHRLRWTFLFLLVMAEVMVGTAAREQVEVLSAAGKLVAADRMLDYIAMGTGFVWHRFLPGGILLLTIFFGIKSRNNESAKRNPFYAVAVLILLQIGFGAVNIVYVLPPYSQVVHIVIGSLLPVICFYYMISGFDWNKRKTQELAAI
jgi:cytochrome c oxidase assembly protein subunit 15